MNSTFSPGFYALFGYGGVNNWSEDVAPADNGPLPVNQV